MFTSKVWTFSSRIGGVSFSGFPVNANGKVCTFLFFYFRSPYIVELVVHLLLNLFFITMAENNSIRPTRVSLIDEIKRRVEDKIIEPQNAELLIKLIKNADSDSDAMAIAQMGTIYNRTGLHFDHRLEKTTDTIHYFKKNDALSFSDGSDKPHHKLIVGDNYHALQNLLIQYRGMVDVIYIDPPYGKDSLGECADTNYENATKM